jgi:hypothetical protein
VEALPRATASGCLLSHPQLGRSGGGGDRVGCRPRGRGADRRHRAPFRWEGGLHGQLCGHDWCGGNAQGRGRRAGRVSAVAERGVVGRRRVRTGTRLVRPAGGGQGLGLCRRAVDPALPGRMSRRPGWTNHEVGQQGQREQGHQDHGRPLGTSLQRGFPVGSAVSSSIGTLMPSRRNAWAIRPRRASPTRN